MYPTIMSSTENKEMQTVSNVMAEQQQKSKDNVTAIRYQARMHVQMISSSSITPSSPTLPVDPSISSTEDSIMMQPHQEGEGNMMGITSIGSGKAVHTVWSDSTSGDFEILYKRDGADFDPTTLNLSNNAGESLSPAISVSGNNVHMVWRDTTPGNNDILYRRSTDGGATFGPTINLSMDPGDSFDAAIAVSGNNVYVVWVDNTLGNLDIFYKRSTDGGTTFVEPTKNLSNNPGSSISPAITISGNDVHVVWGDDTPGNFDIFYRRSVDGGSSFPNIIKNLSSSSLSSRLPSIAPVSNNVHVVWQDFTPGNSDILYRRSVDGGSSFPNIIKNLSDNAGSSAFPALTAIGSNVHVVWGDNTPGNSDILYRRSINSGSTFPNIIKNLSNNAGFSNEPDIAVSGNNVYVVLEDDTAGNFEILYRTSANNGDTFPAILSNLSTNAGASESPVIAVS